MLIYDSLVHIPSTVPAPLIFTYGTTINPQSLSHDSLAENVKPKGNPTTCNIQLNLVLNVPADLDSDPISSYPTLSDYSNSSNDEYYKLIRRTNNNNNKCQSKKSLCDPIKKGIKLTTKLQTAAYKSKVIKFKLHKGTPHLRFCFLSFLNSLKIASSYFK